MELYEEMKTLHELSQELRKDKKINSKLAKEVYLNNEGYIFIYNFHSYFSNFETKSYFYSKFFDLKNSVKI